MSKSIECIQCGDLVKVPEYTEATKCWRCVIEDMQKDGTIDDGLPTRRSKQTTAQGYPKGWRFMKEFVHADGTVYYRGVEQPSLKGTKQATPITLKPKKSKAQKKEEKDALLAEYGKLKKAFQKETRKTYKKKLETKLKRLQKQI
jgi:hypothetical protein